LTQAGSVTRDKPARWAGSFSADGILGTIRVTCYYDTVMNEIEAHQIEERFEATEPRRWHRHIPIVTLLAMLVGFMALPVLGSQSAPIEVLGVLLLMLLVGVFMLLGWTVGRRQQRCRQEVLKAWAHVQLDEWDVAQTALDEVMQRPIPRASDRGQAFMLLAAIAEHDKRYDLAALIYETLLLRRIGDPIHLQQAQIAMTSAKIHNEELADAVDALDRLERVPMPVGLRTALDLVRLFQQVFMGQYEDAAEDCEARGLLYRRHLSTHAAYGYGLQAAAMHHLGRSTEAARMWREATTLVEADRLLKEYAFLAVVSQTYPAAVKPSGLHSRLGTTGREGTENHHRLWRRCHTNRCHRS